LVGRAELRVVREGEDVEPHHQRGEGPGERRGRLRHQSIYSASTPRSPVRMRTASSTGMTKIFPSPIFPDLAARSMASTTLATWSSSTTTSIFTLGRKSTTYSAPL